MNKRLFEKVKIHDIYINNILKNDEYFKLYYKDIYSDNDFFEKTMDRYILMFDQANKNKNIIERWSLTKTIVALKNIKGYNEILNNLLIKKILNDNKNFAGEIPKLLNLSNKNLSKEVQKILKNSIDNNNVCIILNNSKRFIKGKSFEKYII